MDDIITKNSLERTIGFISEIKLDEEDYESIFKKFEPILKNQAIRNKLVKLEEINEDADSIDLETMIKKILDKMSVKDLRFILKKIIKNEALTNSIQDLILEKLI